jgi:hypothetical protein
VNKCITRKDLQICTLQQVSSKSRTMALAGHVVRIRAMNSHIGCECELDSAGSGQGSVAGSCEDGN